MNEELIEQVARAICLAHGLDPERLEPGSVPCVDAFVSGEEHHFTWRHFTEEAQAAIATAEPLIRADERAATFAFIREQAGKKFALGDRVTKIKGSKWTGRVVGFYSTDLTPEGYAVESETEIGSVQIYPAAALTMLDQIERPAHV